LQVVYKLRADIVLDEDNCEYKVYGITALDTYENVLMTVEDIFFDKQKAEEFVELCNQEKLELIHLQYVIEDILL